MKEKTILSHTGRPAQGPVNRPVHRLSTVTFADMAAFEAATSNQDGRSFYRYGRVGNPNSHDFEEIMTALEQGYGAVSMCSGLAAITCVLLAFLRAGDHILIVDTAYGPTRRFSDNHLRHLGVDVEYYDPAIGGAIETLIRPTTKMIYMESPGSQTFELQDVPAIVAVARKRGIITALDNTWATPLFFKPLTHGVNIAIHAATKYIVGHSDATLGVAVCDSKEIFDRLKNGAIHTGICAAPDDLYMAVRGLRTLEPRLARHQESAKRVATWLQTHPAVERILYPALPGDPGHALWKRDFGGANGLFSMILKPVSRDVLRRFIDGLEYFPLGFSWGGYESLLMIAHLEGERTVKPFHTNGPMLRLHIGLEDPQDLIADLAKGLDAMLS